VSKEGRHLRRRRSDLSLRRRFAGLQPFAGVFPQSGAKLRKEFEGVFAEDLATDPCGVFFEQVAAVDLFGQDFRQAAPKWVSLKS
jgi:hypothetical protein